MKTGFYSLLCSFVTHAAIAACFIPFLLLGIKKVRQLACWWALGIYWCLNGLVNLPALEQIRSEGLRVFLLRLSDFYDLVDIPLALLIFAMASPGKARKQLLFVLLGFIAGETLLVGGKGYQYAWPVVIGTGVALILTFTVIGLLRYLKKIEHDHFEHSMAFVYAAFLFAYGTYLIIYLLYYLRTSKAEYNQTDSSLLYYTSLLLSSVVTVAGIVNYGWRWTRKATARYSSSSS
ncbi:MAG TPA: hypothetical protein VHE54_08130 [Puia sp.]|nr:hypothetical protein [Puia sp.]